MKKSRFQFITFTLLALAVLFYVASSTQAYGMIYEIFHDQFKEWRGWGQGGQLTPVQGRLIIDITDIDGEVYLEPEAESVVFHKDDLFSFDIIRLNERTPRIWVKLMLSDGSTTEGVRIEQPDLTRRRHQLYLRDLYGLDAPPYLEIEAILFEDTGENGFQGSQFELDNLFVFVLNPLATPTEIGSTPMSTVEPSATSTSTSQSLPTSTSTATSTSETPPTSTATLVATLEPTSTNTPIPTATPVPVEQVSPTPTAAALLTPTSTPFTPPIDTGENFSCFQIGMNIPWMDYGYGADFATVEEWGQHTYTVEKSIAMFDALAAAGANSTRWWVFADGRGGPEFSGDSNTIGLDSNLLPSIASALQIAHERGISINLVLWDFSMGRGAGHVGVPSSGGHSDLIQDEAKLNAFITNALIPMLTYQTPDGYTIGTHPAATFDVINEPEFMISDLVEPEVENPVSLVEMQRFVARIADAIHRYGDRPVTVGSASIKWLSDQALGAEGHMWRDEALTVHAELGYLDFYQVHYYSWMNGDGVSWNYNPFDYTKAELGFDKPVIIGEASANDAAALIAAADASGYDGIWFWSYEPVDANGSWQAAEGAISGFVSGNPDRFLCD